MTMPFPHQPGDHARCRAVVDRWLAVVDAGSPDERAELLNQQMAAVSAYPRLTDHHQEGWHLHYRDTDDDLALVLESVFAVGTALHLTTRGSIASVGARRAPARTSSWTSPETGRSATAPLDVPVATPFVDTGEGPVTSRISPAGARSRPGYAGGLGSGGRPDGFASVGLESHSRMRGVKKT